MCEHKNKNHSDQASSVKNCTKMLHVSIKTTFIHQNIIVSLDDSITVRVLSAIIFYLHLGGLCMKLDGDLTL